MTIADEIAKEFAKNLAERRAAARQQLVATAADTEALIRSKRPRKSKEKSITEEAHPGEVFVAESDGLGGLVGNLEQVHEQIMNALNRRPSAFPYQGLVANAMLDFQKTAEVLESHDLHDEAETVRKAAREWLSVLRRRGGIDHKTANFFLNKTATPVVDLPEPDMSFLIPPEGVSAPNQPVASVTSVTTPAAPAAVQPSDILKPPLTLADSAAQTNLAGKVIDTRIPKVSGALEAAKKYGGKILQPIGIIFDIYSVASAANRGDWGEFWTMVGGGAVGAGSVVVPALLAGGGAVAALGAGPIILAASTGLAITSAIKLGLTHTSQDGIDEDLSELVGDITSELEDSSYNPDNYYDPTEKVKASEATELLNSMKKEMGDILNSRNVLAAESKKLSREVDLYVVASRLAAIVDSNEKLKADFKSFQKIGSELDWSFLRKTVGFGYPKIEKRIEDVDTSIKNFEEEMTRIAGENEGKVKELESQFKNDAELMKKIREGDLAGGTPLSGAAIRRERGAPLRASDVDDPVHVMEVQSYFGVPKTGKWDAATMRSIQRIMDMWIGYDIHLADVVTEEALKASSRDELAKLSRIWNTSKEALTLPGN
jgi:hypothetical protein